MAGWRFLFVCREVWGGFPDACRAVGSSESDSHGPGSTTSSAIEPAYMLENWLG